MTPAVARRRKRSDVVADAIRARIIDEGLAPGARVPSAWLETDALKVSRGTLREALKALEVEGLIASKTGPGGGIFVTAVEPESALRMLDNLFLHQPPSIADIYALRRLVEPELAAASAGALSPEALASLEATVRLYEAEPVSGEEEYAQRMAELDFHIELARRCPNRVLGFVAAFLASLLRDMAVCREIYRQPNPALRESGLGYQVRLLRAIRAGDAERARALMGEHMAEAERYMLERAEMTGRRPHPASLAR